MKSIALILFLAATSISDGYSQSEKEVFKVHEIVFYGYDYSGFKIADVKRMGQDLKNFVFVWTGFCNDHITDAKLAKWMSKDKVIIDQEPIIARNKKLNSEDLGSISKHSIPPDSIQLFVNKYKVPEKSGIGFVVIVECFDNASKRTSAYFTFFDIATKKVLWQEYISSHDSNSYNRMLDWGTALIIAFKKFIAEYMDKAKSIK